MKYILLSVFAFFLLNCKNVVEEEKLSAGFILNKSIDMAGSDKVGTSNIGFDFRDRYYYASRDNGNYMLMRFTVENDKDSIFDMLTNTGFERHVNNEKVIFDVDSMKVKYSASVNSVHYFSVLPYGLNDEAVNKIRLEDAKINDQMYYAIKVTFDKDGGGEDYEDEFVYWVNNQTFKIDYLAYSYNESDGKGLRFREAYNERYINEIRFVDYNNYKPNDNSISLSELPKLFEKGALKLLSKIELENVKVN